MNGPSWRIRSQTSSLRVSSSAAIAGKVSQPSSMTSSTKASRVPEVGGGPKTWIGASGSEASISFQRV